MNRTCKSLSKWPKQSLSGEGSGVKAVLRQLSEFNHFVQVDSFSAAMFESKEIDLSHEFVLSKAVMLSVALEET